MRVILPKLTSVIIGICGLLLVLFLLLFCVSTPSSFADETAMKASSVAHMVTIYDRGGKLSVKTNAVSVAEVLERAGVTVEEFDLVEPGLETIIDDDNFHINIYRARSVVVELNQVRKQVMTANYDPKMVASDAGFAVYDGDEVELVQDDNFLEAGAVSVYRITRNGGRTVTVDEGIAFVEEYVDDPEMNEGETQVTQVGEDGVKTLVYQVNFVDNEEVARELVSEEIAKEPVKKIIKRGTKRAASEMPAVTVAPGQETCAEWARAAGVSEADLSAALFLIYHESGCRVNATNASSGAYGIPQALPGSKMASAGADWQTNPVTQIRWMAGYVNRYGGWQGAYAFWTAHHWY